MKEYFYRLALIRQKGLLEEAERARIVRQALGRRGRRQTRRRIFARFGMLFGRVGRRPGGSHSVADVCHPGALGGSRS